MMIAILAAFATSAAAQTCEALRTEQRALVEDGSVEEALDLCHAVVEVCRQEWCEYAGEVDLQAFSNGEMRVRLHEAVSADMDATFLPCRVRDRWSIPTADRLWVHGFILDGTFIAVSHGAAGTGTRLIPALSSSAVAGRRVQQEPTYTRGLKSMLVIPACPAAGCSFDITGYDGDVVKYLKAVVDFANGHLFDASWGLLQFDATIVQPVLLAGYSQADCRKWDTNRDGPLGYSTFQADPSALDMRAFAQVEQDYGLDFTDFDFYAVVMPYCSAIGWSGIGWVGQPGFVLNLRRGSSSNLDPAFVHELGHNLGLNHGARFTGGARGRAIAETTFADNDFEQTPGGYSEYGSAVTVMGRGRTPDAHYLLPAKLILDWTPPDSIVEVNLPGACTPCGPYLLQPTDSGVLGPSPTLGLRIATEISSRYFWVEQRELLPGGPAIVIASASFSSTAGGGGIVGLSAMVDTLQGSASGAQPAVGPGSSVQLDLSAEGGAWPLSVQVGSRSAGGLLEVTLSSTPLPPSPPPPPCPLGCGCGCAAGPCAKQLSFKNSNFELIEGEGGCCSGRCSYCRRSAGSCDRYLHYFPGDVYEHTPASTAPCFTGGRHPT